MELPGGSFAMFYRYQVRSFTFLDFKKIKKVKSGLNTTDLNDCIEMHFEPVAVISIVKKENL